MSAPENPETEDEGWKLSTLGLLLEDLSENSHIGAGAAIAFSVQCEEKGKLLASRQFAELARTLLAHSTYLIEVQDEIVAALTQEPKND